ncbi:Csu type fimbrial protein [Rhizobium tumorigenes]|uniref:Spore coat U domain-containing protein n=1 Tax=Rhizobium tumorigenes TaxID=2041385 RepID=A0AAF1KC07_9HYPH|nr:spore coat U domain-containing protein [Rhizobium tumorigenes]WFR99185.1 spore coat U domain-containing protein [Rhizobium tumorigenes]
MKSNCTLFYTTFSMLVLLAGTTSAQTSSSQFNVQMTITSDCQITSAGNMDFGSTGVIGSNKDATSAIVVQCTSGTAYNIGLDTGRGVGATVTTRYMTGPATAKLGYSLFTDTGRTTTWGNTVSTNTMSATGTGSTQSYTVYGRVPPQATPAPGAYTDIVAVTLTY